MGIFARLLEELYRVAAKYRCALIVVGVGALAVSSPGISGPALAQCAGPASNTICTPGGNPYPGGINVNTNNTPITVTLQSDDTVVIPAGAGGVNAVNAANSTGPGIFGADVNLTANNSVTIENSKQCGYGK
jgi:hypothetical protein